MLSDPEASIRARRYAILVGVAASLYTGISIHTSSLLDVKLYLNPDAAPAVSFAPSVPPIGCAVESQSVVP